MQISISVRHAHLSESTQERIRTKLTKLQRYFDRLTSIELTVELDQGQSPTVDLKVSAEHKHDFVATESRDELMAAVDAAIQKLEQQLRKYKERIQSRHRSSGARQQGTENRSRAAEE